MDLLDLVTPDVVAPATRPPSSRTGPTRPTLERVAEDSCRTMPPLVFAGEAREPHRPSWPQVAEGEAFLLQAGDCAESFDAFSADSIRDKLQGHPADGRRAHLLVGRARR